MEATSSVSDDPAGGGSRGSLVSAARRWRRVGVGVHDGDVLDGLRHHLDLLDQARAEHPIERRAGRQGDALVLRLEELDQRRHRVDQPGPADGLDRGRGRGGVHAIEQPAGVVVASHDGQSDEGAVAERASRRRARRGGRLRVGREGHGVERRGLAHAHVGVRQRAHQGPVEIPVAGGGERGQREREEARILVVGERRELGGREPAAGGQHLDGEGAAAALGVGAGASAGRWG